MSLHPDGVPKIAWNCRSESSGTDGRFAPERVAGIGRIRILREESFYAGM